MKIAIVGLDDKFVVDFSNKLASILQLTHINLNEEFSKTLLKTIHQPLFESYEYENNIETNLIKQILDLNNIIISLTDDEFLSNEHYLLFKDVLTIIIEKKEEDAILKNIQKLIKKHCKIKIKQEKINIEEILNKIRGN